MENVLPMNHMFLICERLNEEYKLEARVIKHENQMKNMQINMETLMTGQKVTKS